MLSEEEINSLLDELKNYKEEVAVLKKKLNKVNKEKEDWFSKKSDIGSDIKEKITTVKQLKRKRNELTNKVRDLKKERNELNTKISENIKKITTIKQNSAPSHGKDRKMSPGRLKREIEKLEQKIEISPMSFQAEQKVMKQIKAMKKELVAMGGGSESGDLKTLSKDTDKLKKQANKLHKELQDTAKESQKLHEKLITLSKEIDDEKKGEEDSYQKFFDQKKEFSNLNNQLKDKLKKVQEIKSKLDENKVELTEEKAKSEAKTLKQKAKEVEEKISKKKKLTTEDLLIMQRKH